MKSYLRIKAFSSLNKQVARPDTPKRYLYILLYHTSAKLQRYTNHKKIQITVLEHMDITTKFHLHVIASNWLLLCFMCSLILLTTATILALLCVLQYVSLYIWIGNTLDLFYSSDSFVPSAPSFCSISVCPSLPPMFWFWWDSPKHSARSETCFPLCVLLSVYSNIFLQLYLYRLDPPKV